MPEPQQFSEVFMSIVDLAKAAGVEGINRLSGPWVYQVDDRWRVAVNGHNHPVKLDPEGDGSAIEIPPFHAYLERDGWPAGMVNPHDGVIAGARGALEAELIQALRKAATEARAGG